MIILIFSIIAVVLVIVKYSILVINQKNSINTIPEDFLSSSSESSEEYTLSILEKNIFTNIYGGLIIKSDDLLNNALSYEDFIDRIESRCAQMIDSGFNSFEGVLYRDITELVFHDPSFNRERIECLDGESDLEAISKRLKCNIGDIVTAYDALHDRGTYVYNGQSWENLNTIFEKWCKDDNRDARIKAAAKLLVAYHEIDYKLAFSIKVLENIENGDKVEQEEIEKNKEYGVEPEGDPILHKNENYIVNEEDQASDQEQPIEYDTDTEDGMDMLVSMNVAEIFESEDV